MIYEDSFGAAAFLAINEARRNDEARVGVHEIPGGNGVYIDLGGRQPPRLSLELLLESDAVYSTLRGLVGTQDSLVYSEGSYTAVLVSIDRGKTFHSGQHLISAEFLLV